MGGNKNLKAQVCIIRAIAVPTTVVDSTLPQYTIGYSGCTVVNSMLPQYTIGYGGCTVVDSMLPQDTIGYSGCTEYTVVCCNSIKQYATVVPGSQ